jgi:hypothetical protein
MPSLVARATDVLRELEPNWPMARKWIGILQRSPATAVDQVVRADLAGDTATGVLAHNSLDAPLCSPAVTLPGTSTRAASATQLLSGLQPQPPLAVNTLHIPVPALHATGTHTPTQHSWGRPSADGLHALAMAAAELPVPTDPFASGMHAHPSVQYVDMPFGDPTQQHSFHDVLAYMNGEPNR